MMTFNLQYLAGLAWTQGNVAEASMLYREALAYFGPAGDDLGIARCLEGLSKVAAKEGAYPRAVRLSATAERLREGMKSPLPPSEVAEYQAALDSARAGMAADDFDAARYDGRTVDLADGIDVALHDT